MQKSQRLLIFRISTLGLLAALIGFGTVKLIFENIGDTLVEWTDGDGVVFPGNDPTRLVVYGGTDENPEVLPQLDIGESRNFQIDGHVVAYNPLYGRLCAATNNANGHAPNSQLAIFYPEQSGETGTVSIYIQPAGPPCDTY